jgi:hypothetical protein
MRRKEMSWPNVWLYPNYSFDGLKKRYEIPQSIWLVFRLRIELGTFWIQVIAWNNYEGEPVNITNGYRTLKNVIFKTGKNIYFSTYRPAELVPSLYQCVETRSIEVFWLPSQPLRFIICNFRTSSREFLDPVINSFTRQTLPNLKSKYFFINIFAAILSINKIHTTECFSSAVHSSNTVAILTTETSLWICAWASATSTVLLPNVTHRKCITSIRADLLPFVSSAPFIPISHCKELL